MSSEISACGLVCGNCRKYRNGKCSGCRAYNEAVWCGVRRCCIEHGWRSCADCNTKSLDECKEFNSFISKIFKILFRSDRKGCIERIRKVGYDAYAAEMDAAGRMNRPITEK